VAANIASPAAPIINARMPPPASRAATRFSSSAIARPPTTPVSAPKPNCCTKAQTTVPHADTPPAAPCVGASSAMKASVRNTAIGSLTPDSISSVAATRSFSVTPERVSSANTAAASVEPTMAPSSIAVPQSRPRNSMLARPVSAAHSSTPTVASTEAGFSPVRKVEKAVRNPPSSRMMASAKFPTQKLSRMSSNR
jgi:hypothetical protein